MRGEIKLTFQTFPLNGETSDTNDNVKTKINTKHMKPDSDVTLFVVLCCHTHSLHTSHGSRCSRVCVISSTHEVSVSSDFFDLSITFIFFLSFHINFKRFLLPFTSTRSSSNSLCIPLQGDGVYGRVLLQHTDSAESRQERCPRTVHVFLWVAWSGIICYVFCCFGNSGFRPSCVFILRE